MRAAPLRRRIGRNDDRMRIIPSLYYLPELYARVGSLVVPKRLEHVAQANAALVADQEPDQERKRPEEVLTRQQRRALQRKFSRLPKSQRRAGLK